jgi:hypothetical protein
MPHATKRYLVDGVDRYVIEFHKQLLDSTWKLFCFQHPHNPRSTDVAVCHLFSSGQVCVAAGREPRSLAKAKAIGMFWANGYSTYIRTGVFPNGSTKVNVPD